MTDVALTEDDSELGTLIAHRLDCAIVQRHREEGRMICSMFGSEEPLPPDLKRHSCLRE